MKQIIFFCFLLLSSVQLFAQPANLSKGQKYPNGKETDYIGNTTMCVSKTSLTSMAYCNNSYCFKFEEGDLSDCYMTDRLKSKVERLGSLVDLEWDGECRILITEAWDDRNEHSDLSSHYEGRAVDIVVIDDFGNRLNNKYGRLGGLAIEAGFDWVWYEGNHIHASVKK